MWDHTDGCTNQYRCASSIYILSFLDLYFIIIIDISVGDTVHGKYAVDGLNDRHNRIIKIAMEKLLNPELIQDDTKNVKSMQVHENE